MLEYTGIIKLHNTGVKGTKSEIGSRYEVNFGCLLALESTLTNALTIIKKLSPRNPVEYGVNSKHYEELVDQMPTFSEPNLSDSLQKQLAKSIDVLQISSWQKGKLRELGIQTLGETLASTEEDLQQAHQIGPYRSRQMKNAAMAAVFEYLFG